MVLSRWTNGQLGGANLQSRVCVALTPGELAWVLKGLAQCKQV